MIEVGLIGLGTVGLGVYEGLAATENELESILGDKVRVKKILVKNKLKQRDVTIEKRLLTEASNEFLSENYDVVFEAIGGIEPAKNYICYFLERGIPVITANKELVAKYGEELEQLAFRNHTFLGYEAAVAGGIPIVNVLRSHLQWNTIEKVSGIINGTTNYILTEMHEKGRDFEEVLAETQQLGYAEADPTDDVEGYDAWYKIRILSRLCFGRWPKSEDISIKGISQVKAWHVKMAKELGLTLKLVAEASFNGERVIGSVTPSFLTSDHPLRKIDGVTNAISLSTTQIGGLLLSGPGAGKGPTSASMIEDFLHHVEKKQNSLLQKSTKAIITNEKKVLIFSEDLLQRKEIESLLSLVSAKDSYVYELGNKTMWITTLQEQDLSVIEETQALNYYPIYGRWVRHKMAVTS